MTEVSPLTSACGGPSLQTLRRLDTGELAGEARQSAEQHVTGCTACQSVLQDWAAERAALRTVLPFEAFEAKLAARRRPWWTRLVAHWKLSLLVPAAAAAALVLALPRADGPQTAPEDGPIRAKGGASLSFVVRTADGARDGQDGEPLHAGDSIRLKYGAAGKPFVLIVGVDADGEVFPYLAQGDRSSPAAAGAPLAPNSITLDEDPRPERIFALYSTEPLAIDEVRPAAKDAVQQAGGRVERITRLPLPGSVEQATVLLNKAH